MGSTLTEAIHAAGSRRRAWETLVAYVRLIKPGIVALVLLTGLTAMALEGSLLAEPLRLAGALLGLLLAAGAANALNQFWDRDIDSVMARTRNRRPIPAGTITPRGALYFGLSGGALAAWLLKTAGNTLTGFLGISAMAFYVFLYTMWLKRRTPLNIVIGGAAGAMAPLIGWAAGADSLSMVPALMFLVVFLWTPPHFWALALYLKEEYAQVGIPMLPVAAGEKKTIAQIAAYIALLLLAVFYLGICADLGWSFAVGAALLGANLVRKTVLLRRRRDRQSAQELFRYSIVYLTALFALMLFSALSSSCWAAERPHSILDPGGPNAERIAELWWQMLGVYGAVFLVTLLLMVLALVARRRDRPVLGSRFVFVCGIAIPALILVLMLVHTIRITVQLTEGPGDFRVQVIGRHWWFEVRYPDYGIVDANEIHVPVGSSVRYELSSDGVIHSFWIPRLGGKRDLLPDHPTELLLKAERPGVYHGTCTEYCGGPHALMAFRQVVHTEEDFRDWLRRARQPRTAPSDPWLERGGNVFMEAGCAACHAINGLSEATSGPDLTLVGSRLTLGAGQLPNSIGNLSGWIANPQTLKPRNLMPRFYLPPEDLHSLVDYLWSLQ